jgi:hypothetical protein
MKAAPRDITKNASELSLVAELLNVGRKLSRRKTLSSNDANAEIRRIAKHDYAQALRRRLSRAQVRQVLAAGRKAVWPGLNRRPLRLVSQAEFARHWSGLGVEIKFAKLPGKRDLTLLGFYSKEIEGVRRRPLICVNTAHHPAIVGAALAHEMSHHVTVRMFKSRGNVARFLSRTGYDEHLSDQAELAADVLVSVGIYPKRIARSLLNPQAPRLRPSLVVFDAAAVITYIANQYGLRFDRRLLGERKLQAVATLLHYTKLRRALLEEYDL